MRPLRAWLIRLGGVFRFGRRDDVASAEIESHLQLQIDDNVRSGMTPAEARRAALIRFGGFESTKEALRDRRALPILDHLSRDLRYASRTLKSGTSLTAIGMLALAIGVTTAMFAVMDALILRPLPFPDANRLGFLVMFGKGGGPTAIAPSVLRAWQSNPVFENAEGVTTGTTVLDTNDGPVVRTSAFITPGLFEMVGVHPVRGRLFDANDAQDDHPDSVVISEDLWRSVFGGDPATVGRRVQIDKDSAVVIGILPRGFRFPAWDTEIWRPTRYDVGGTRRPQAYVRLAKGIPREEALRVATDLAHRLDPTTASRKATWLEIAGGGSEKYYLMAVPVLVGGVALVFLALCANVSGLLLARFSTRQQQFSLCSALGASRARLLSQAFIESAVLATIGAAAGIGLALTLVSVARTFLPQTFLKQTLHPVGIDQRALVLATGLGILATLIAGLLPAWMATRFTRGSSLAGNERSGTENQAGRVLTRCLLVGEIAFACTLLVGATLLIRSFVNLSLLDRGFDPRGLMTVSLLINGPKDGKPALFAQADEAIRQLPGVERVTWSGGTPGNATSYYFTDWQPDTPQTLPVHVDIESYVVGPDYFSSYRIPILRGRAFQPGDRPDQVIVGERIAAALWPGLDPLGRSFTGNHMRFEVIGVAKEVRRPLVGVDQRLDMPSLYEPLATGQLSGIATIRCQSCPSEGVIRRSLLPSGSLLRVLSVQRLEQTASQDLAQPRATAALGFAFAAIALIAAAGGLFSVLTYAVGRRRREFGIRFALGARAGEIRSLVLRDGLAVVIPGIAVGALAAWLLTSAMASLEYGITVNDPVSWLVVLATLGLTALVASWRPARAAAHVDPVALLRED